MAQLMTFFCLRFPEVLFGSPGHNLHLSSITLNLLSPQLSFFMVLKCDLFVYRGNLLTSSRVHDELETTTQDERSMNPLENAQIFFCVGMFIQGLFIISIVK